MHDDNSDRYHAARFTYKRSHAQFIMWRGYTARVCDPADYREIAEMYRAELHKAYLDMVAYASA
jgi:hypothetical protein